MRMPANILSPLNRIRGHGSSDPAAASL